MGTGCSLPLPDLPTPNYMSIVISGVDTFILLYSGKNELDAVRTSIQQNWSKGIQLEKAEMNDPTNVSSPKAYSFKLLGSPFGLTTSKAEAIQVRRMCGAILQGLRNMGWQLLVSSDLSRSLDLSTWYFQQQFVQFDTQKILEVGLSSTDKLQIVDCPPNIFQVIKNIVSQTWVRGIQAESQIDQFTYEIKLHGNPWSFVDKAESCSSRFMIKEIVTELSKQQWHLYGNSNLKSTADTLFFRFDQNLPFGEQFMIISLNQTDRIRLIHCEDSLITLIENTIRQWWHLGIQEVFDERPFCYEIKLRGNPWWADGDDAVRSRVLIVHLMEKMASVGFFITTGVDVSRKLNDKSLLLFKRGQPLQTQFLCVSLNETDKIRLINAPQHMIELGRSLIANLWSMGLQEEKQLGDGVSYQAKLKGNPWSSVWRGDGIHGRALLVHILYHFTAYGWRLVCSADVSAKFVHQENAPDYPIDVHSWYFMYDGVMHARQQQFAQPLYPSCNPPPYQ